MTTKQPDEYPIRINKYLALHAYATRRAADSLIEAGLVTINGRVAVLGDKVQEGDSVVVDKESIKKKQETYVYYAYNKPVGVVSHSPQSGEKAISDVVNLRGVFPLGRLDKESHGLILLTNDGRLTERLLSPQFNHEKEYVVRVNKQLKQSVLTRLAKGVKIEDYITKPAVAEEVSPYMVRLIITEGKRHQIRRMLTALGYEVVDLERVRVMNIRLGDLAVGKHRPLTEGEKKDLFSELGL